MSEHQFQVLAHEDAGRKPAVRRRPALGAVLLLGFSVYASRATMAPALPASPLSQAGAAATADDKTTANAVAKANAFLEMLDAPQRGKTLLEYDSRKKS